jgi:hypothetical protein
VAFANGSPASARSGALAGVDQGGDLRAEHEMAGAEPRLQALGDLREGELVLHLVGSRRLGATDDEDES